MIDNVETNEETQVEKQPKHKYEYLDELMSWLDFNNRVIYESSRSINPIIERLNFIKIADSNLDEFIRTKYKFKKDIRVAIQAQTDEIEKQYGILIKELETNGIKITDVHTLDQEKIKYCKKYFKNNLYPLIQPLVLKNELPIPIIQDGGSFIVTKIDNDTPKGVSCIIQLPKNVLVKVPSDEKGQIYVQSDDIIEYFIDTFYKNSKILWNKRFRIFREVSSLSVDPDKNYIDGIRDQLYNRKKATIMIIDVKDTIEGIETLVGKAKMRTRKYVSGLGFLSGLPNKDSLTYDKVKPRTPIAFADEDRSIFDIISEHDVVVHFPYESFDKSSLRFIKEASEDPDVTTIKQTLYRVSKNSPITKYLINAAKAGKTVVVLLELKAKMDEFNNLKVADELANAGCHVIFGPVDMKTHGKATLVIRRENGKLTKYFNISTGNFNDVTAKIYEDISIFSKEKKSFSIGDDLCALFNYLGAYGELPSPKQLLIAPTNFRSTILYEIDNCINSGNKATIIMKCNALTDKKICKKLYEASNAGVKIKLIVRGMCILKPGIPNQSENIEVISVVGRYLEHSRYYEFRYSIDNEDGTDNVIKSYIGSGDIMPRNLDRRVEILLPIYNMKDVYDELHKQVLCYFNDVTNSYKLKSDGVWDKPQDEGFSIQNALIKEYKIREKSLIK